jgi:hypothetical protein
MRSWRRKEGREERPGTAVTDTKERGEMSTKEELYL